MSVGEVMHAPWPGCSDHVGDDVIAILDSGADGDNCGFNCRGSGVIMIMVMATLMLMALAVMAAGKPHMVDPSAR